MTISPSKCSHPNPIEEDGELYCSDCNRYFTKDELRKLNEIECECCSATLVVGEICFCRG